MFLKCLCILQHRISRWTTNEKNHEGGWQEREERSSELLEKGVTIHDREGKYNFGKTRNILKKAVSILKETKWVTFFSWLFVLDIFNGYSVCFLEYLKSCIVLDKWKKQTFSTYCCFTFIYKFYEFHSFCGVILLL